uniref:Uncharacterized protein n=1 Tax=Anopheles stephensi TaxID=30069 RepID=A0A182YNS5_ANOST
MCLLMMSAFLLMLSCTARMVSAAPQSKGPETAPPEGTGERSTYSPMADIGRLASGASGFIGQFWNTGTRIEPEKEQTTAAPKADDDSQKESVETPNVKTDDSPRDKPDMSQVDFMQQVITSVMKQVADGFKDRLKVLPFVL